MCSQRARLKELFGHWKTRIFCSSPTACTVSSDPNRHIELDFAGGYKLETGITADRAGVRVCIEGIDCTNGKPPDILDIVHSPLQGSTLKLSSQ